MFDTISFSLFQRLSSRYKLLTYKSLISNVEPGLTFRLKSNRESISQTHIDHIFQSIRFRMTLISPVHVIRR